MIEWQAIETVLLDMDGTLLDLRFDNFFWLEYVPKRYAEKTGLSEEAAFARIKEWIDRHLGTLNWYCLDFWSRELDMNVAGLKREVADRIALRPGALEFLRALKSSGRKPVLVTNAHPDALSLKLERTGIDDYFEHVETSHHFGVAKEEEGFWDALREEIPFDPAATMLVDDSLRVLHSAADFGIGHLFSIRRPDSGQPPREHTDPYPAIDDFLQILPEASHE